MEGSVAVLGQQELLEAPPRRRLIVSGGHTAWWGIDPSTARVAVAGVYREPCDGLELERWVRTQPFALHDGVARLAEIYARTHGFVAGLAERERRHNLPLPGLVLVEQPSGRVENPQLVYAVGVIQAAVYAALRDVFGRPVRVETCTSSWWKKRACGNGAIYKPTRKRLGRTPVFEDYRVAVWARENGYAGSSWDEADAFGIAEAGRRDVALDAR